MADKTARHKKAFIAAYRELGNITGAAAAAGVNRSSHYRWLEVDPDYPARFEEAHEAAIDSLEGEARRRAVEGVEKPVFQGGQQVGTIRTYSDVLLIFLLKGAMPEKYAERRRIEQTPSQETPIQVSFDQDFYRTAGQLRQQLLQDGDYLEFLRSRAERVAQVQAEPASGGNGQG